MPSAARRFDHEPFELILKRWKRAVEKDGTLQEYRKREFFEKPSAVRKRAKAAAKKRLQRTLENQRDPSKKVPHRPPSKSPTKKKFDKRRGPNRN